MNRRNFITSTTLVTAAAALIPSAWAASDGKIGTVEPVEWKKLNNEAGAKVKSIKPDSGKLSDTDQKLILEVAMGGMMQLELSKAAVMKASSADVKAYAMAEVEEQTGLAAKLKEIANAKGATLPEASNDMTRKLVDKLNSKSGGDFDAHYLKQCGVGGHELLEKTMTKVQSKSGDAILKELAVTTLPLIRMHLQVARDEMIEKS